MFVAAEVLVDLSFPAARSLPARVADALIRPQEPAAPYRKQA